MQNEQEFLNWCINLLCAHGCVGDSQMKNGQGIFELLCNFVNLEDNCSLCSVYLIQTEDNMCASVTE